MMLLCHKENIKYFKTEAYLSTELKVLFVLFGARHCCYFLDNYCPRVPTARHQILRTVVRPQQRILIVLSSCCTCQSEYK